jgi:predicted GTPase
MYGTESSARRCEALMKRLADDRFRVAIVGQFGRGKSSLLNAIVGRSLLPVGLPPLTSTTTIVKYGPKERLVVRHRDRRFPEICAASALANYVTESGNPGNHRNIATATVEVPLSYLRPGLEFVDTPGIGSEAEAHTAETQDSLPRCDAVLFVISPEAPFSRAEGDFLQTIHRCRRKIFYVLNKTDLLPDEEDKRAVTDSLSAQLWEQIGAERVHLFPISARLSLEATLHPATSPLDGNQLNGLKEALANFLSHEKASVFLASILDRAKCLVADELGEANLYQNGQELLDLAQASRLTETRERFRKASAARSELIRWLRAHLSECANVPLETEFSRLLANQSTLMGRQTLRLLARAGCRPGADVSERCGKWFVPKMRRKAKAWFEHHSAHLAFGSDQRRQELWAGLLNNVRELAAGVDIVGLPLESTEELTWPGVLPIQGPILSEFSWSPGISALLLCIPTCASRRLLAKAIHQESNRLVEAVRWETKSRLNTIYNSIVDLRAGELEAHAAEIEQLTIARLGEAQARPAMPDRAPESGNEHGQKATLRDLSDRLSALRESISTIDSQEDAVPAAPTTTRTFDPGSPAQRQIDRALSPRLSSRGCPVCDYLGAVLLDFFSRAQYSLYSDEQSQNAFAATGGLCALHLWQLHSVSSPIGEAAGLAPLVERVSRMLAQVRNRSQAQGAVNALLLDSDSCPTCARLQEDECDFIKRLAWSLDEPEGLAAYDRSQGVCLRHLAVLIRAVSRDDLVRFLIAGAAQHFQETAEDMHSYATLLAVGRRDLTHSDEVDAALRAITHLVGSRSLCMPPSGKGEL